jgi:hypothetical protein
MIKIMRDVMLMACKTINTSSSWSTTITYRVGDQEWQSNAKPIAEAAENKFTNELDCLANEGEVVEHANGADYLSITNLFQRQVPYYLNFPLGSLRDLSHKL